MTRNLYALLVGIDKYDKRSRVPFLRGCVNDIHGMQSYLEGRVASDEFELHLQVLTNEQATREGIMAGFQQHLSQAKGDDVALFYYAGHGAQSAAPKAFWPVSPDRMMETLVCYDSRTDKDHWDIADKELAQLIAEVDQNKPHIVVVLDCCHSGSGTREVGELEGEEGDIAVVATRKAPPDTRERPLESFIVSPEGAQALSGSGTHPRTRSVSASPTSIKLPAGRHVVLSACSNIEEAKEYLGAGDPRGTFSYFLQESLAKASDGLSYRDLFKRTNALVRTAVGAQSPQLEATHSEDLAQPFLGGAIAPSTPYFTVSYHKEHGWSIDGGAIHGLQAPAGDQTTTLSLFPFDAQPDQLKSAEGSVGTATITQVLPQLSQVESDALVETSDTFKAVVVSSPLPPLQVFLQGDEAGLASLQQALNTVGPMSAPSFYVQVIDTLEGAAFRVLAKDGAYVITSPIEDRPLVKPVNGYDTASALKVAQDLEHIARWKTIAELDSPASSQIHGAVEAKIYTGDEANKDDATEITDAQIRLEYAYNQTKQAWAPPRFRIKLHNTSEKTLYCALFYLTERFKADPIKPDGVGSVVRLLPDQEIWFANGGALNGTIADDLWRSGITECQDILKLIACTDEFDPDLMRLGELGSPVARTRSVTTGGSLNRLMQRVNTRDIGFADEAPVYDDWVASQITFTFVRPLLSTPLNQAQPISVGSHVRISPHGELGANVRLTTVPQSTRDLGSAILPPLLQAETEPFQFTTSRASDPGLSALELSNVSNPESVTPENPLRIETEMPLAADEYLLPVAYDGEFYLPLGYGHTGNSGKTEIVIERLTEPVTEGNRSIHGSIRIFFQKVLAKKIGSELSKTLGLDFKYPLLAVAQVEEEGEKQGKVTYLHDAEQVKAKVAQAKNIALYIHGIFGDTASILPSVNTAIAAIEDESRPIGELYDLVLAFDYENLNTTIDQNARSLKSRLADIGLAEGHDKTLHIIAHSMGGLVSRWFVEREGGNKVVNHLIMLGTPNAGSPWPQVQAGITAAVSFAINGLSLVAAPLMILNGLLKRIETVDVSLDQMQPKSDFLNEIAQSPDPGIPYTLVVGNTSLIPHDETASLKDKLIRKLGKIAEMPFLNKPNDIAVLVDSITAIPAGRSPKPKELPTACNHLEYFTNPIGLASLTEAVVGTGLAASGAVGSRQATANTTTSPTANATASATPDAVVAETTDTDPVTLEPVVSEPVVPEFSPSESASPVLSSRSITTAKDNSVAAEPSSETVSLDAPSEPSLNNSKVENNASASVGSVPITSTETPQLPRFEPLPSAPEALAAPIDDEPSPFIAERQKPSGPPIKLWVIFALAGFLGAILAWGWLQLTSTDVEPLPGTTETESEP